MIKAIVKMFFLAGFGVYSFAMIMVSLAEPHTLGPIDWSLLFNVAVTFGLYCVYALPLRPSGWSHNYYIITDILLVGHCCFMFALSVRGYIRMHERYSVLKIVPIYAAMILVVTVTGLLGHIWAFRRYRQKIKKGELTEDPWAIF